MYTTALKVVSLVDKDIRDTKITTGEVITVLINASGYAMLSTNSTIRFTPDEYEVFIGDDEYKLLGL